MSPVTIYTIGHSTRDLAEFTAVLQAHNIEMVVDIRSFPMSRRHPQFNREELQAWLPEVGSDYLWMKELGGRRKKIRQDSPHIALHSDSFRNYADYMLTSDFQQAAAQLVGLASRQRTACMCAEKLYFNCHRMMVSDHLTAQGHTVLHILDEKPPRLHKLMEEARLEDGQLIYRGDRLL